MEYSNVLYNTIGATPLAGVERCYTIDEVAAHLNISASTLKKMISKGYITTTKLGNQNRIFESDLLAFIKQVRGKKIVA